MPTELRSGMGVSENACRRLLIWAQLVLHWFGVLLLVPGEVGLVRGSALRANYDHTSWSWQEGFKAFPVQALAQTEDGYLWIGTPFGLWHFDGDRFVQCSPSPSGPELASQDIRALCPGRSGVLWIGTAVGFSKLEAGQFTNYTLSGPADPAGIRALLYDAAQGLWIGTPGPNQTGLLLFNDPARSFIGENRIPNSGVNVLYRDRHGALWIGTRRGLCRWRPPDWSVFLTNPPSEIYSITEDSGGRLLITCSGRDRLLYFDGTGFSPLNLARSDLSIPRAILAPTDGSLWLGTFSQGLTYVKNEVVDHLTARDGLSGSIVQALLQDREQDVWVGTRTGLDRFRRSSIGRLPSDTGLPEDVVTTLFPSRRGGVWIGTATAGLYYAFGDKVRRQTALDPYVGQSILSLYERRNGDLWIGTAKGVVVQRAGQISRVFGADGAPLNRVIAITGDAQGRVWLADGLRGVYSVSTGIAQRLDIPGLQPFTDVYSMVANGADNLWIGYYHGEVVQVRAGKATHYQSGKDLTEGPVLRMTIDQNDQPWAVTTGGISRFRDGRWDQWSVRSGALPAAPREILFDGSGGVWLQTVNEIVRISTRDLDASADRASQPPRLVRYGISKGVSPQPGIMRAQPRVCKTPGGQLWFAGDAGVSIVNPQATGAATVSPMVIIERIELDGQKIPVDGGVHSPLKFYGHTLEVDYTATNLSGYEGIQFSYQLSGMDRSPGAVGTTRHARYTNLARGYYEFSAKAFNTQDGWTSTSNRIKLVVVPAFHQTLFFRALCCILFGGLLMTLYRIRLGQIARKYRALNEARLAERTRIATDLHDTLLQSVVGASLQLEAVSNSSSTGTGTPSLDLRRIRRQLEDALRETRHAVWALRSPRLDDCDLPQALYQTGQSLIGPRNLNLEVRVHGRSRRLGVEREEHLLRIGQEAITNAVFHSQGRNITVDFDYSPQCVLMRVIDDGHGFDEAMNGRIPGHFGLSGMRERAERLGASLGLVSSESGTEVSLTIPQCGDYAGERLSFWTRVIHWKL